MSELPDPSEVLTGKERELYEHFCALRGGKVDGMYKALMNHPAVTEYVSNLGAFLRFQSTLPGNIREFIILYSAHRVHAAYEWVKHLHPAKDEGIPVEVIEAVRTGKDEFPAPYSIFPEFVDLILNLKSIPEPLQKQIIQLVGIKGLIEAVVLIGFYRMIGGIIFAFDIPLPAGKPV